MGYRVAKEGLPMSDDQKSYTPAMTGYRRWLANGAHYTPEAVARVSELMLADAGGRSDATGRFRPSMAGDKCPRRQMLSYRGMPAIPPDLASQDFMTAGTFGHYRWQLAGLSEGFLTDIEVKVANKWGVKGSGDGLLAEDGSLLELKTTGSRLFSNLVKSMHPKPDHVQQTMMMTLDTDIEWTSIVYEDRDMPQRRIEFRVNVGDTNPTYPSLKTAVIKRLELLNGHADAGTLPEMLTSCTGLSGPDYRECPWRKVCPTLD
jgi:hypothetical protein